jgi:hypothetical protein
VSYPGAKSGAGVYQAIISQMPPHDTYIETHLGSGIIMQRKPGAPRSIGIDRDPIAVNAAASWKTDSITLVHARAEDFLEHFDFAAAGDVLVYADPPYIRGPGEVRTDADLYRHEYSRADHARLIAILRSIPAAVMLSGYRSQLYDDLLPDWRRIEYQVMTRGGVRRECLWMNFPVGQVQWASFAGKNFTERQQIKRKADRWRKKYRNLAPAARLAVLSAILDEEEAGADVVDFAEARSKNVFNPKNPQGLG